MVKTYTPEEILPSGDDYTLAVNPFTGESGKARKGIIVATLNNIVLLNQLLNSDKEVEQIHAITKVIIELLPSLKVTGVFDLFNLEEWIDNPYQLGRVYVGVLYLKAYPQEINLQQITKLKKIKEMTISPMLHDEIEKVCASF